MHESLTPQCFRVFGVHGLPFDVDGLAFEIGVLAIMLFNKLEACILSTFLLSELLIFVNALFAGSLDHLLILL